MRKRFKRSRVLRSSGLATAVVGAALVLAGCWGTVYTGGGKSLNIKKKNSEEIAYRCALGSTYERGDCANAYVRFACAAQPLPNLSQSDCARMTSSSQNVDMGNALIELSQEGGCLHVYYISSPDPDWQATPCFNG